MQINFIQKLSSSHKVNVHSQQNLNKRDLMKMIMNNEIKVLHNLENQILRKKILKCYIHGSDRKIEIKSNQQKNIQKYQSEKIIHNTLKRRKFSLGIEAPNIIGTKNQLFTKQQSIKDANYRGHSAFQQNRGNMRSCCDLRGSSIGESQSGRGKQSVLKMREKTYKLSTGGISPIRIPKVQQSPKQWEDEDLLRQIGLSRTSIGFRSLSKQLY